MRDRALEGYVVGRYCAGWWWIRVGRFIGSGASFKEAWANALLASVN